LRLGVGQTTQESGSCVCVFNRFIGDETLGKDLAVKRLAQEARAL
jgi:hypothetical protein